MRRPRAAFDDDDSLRRQGAAGAPDDDVPPSWADRGGPTTNDDRRRGDNPAAASGTAGAVFRGRARLKGLAAVLALVCGVQALLSRQQGKGQVGISGTTADNVMGAADPNVVGDLGGGGGAGVVKIARPRTGFRELNMLGFDNVAEEEGQGEWRTCREYKENELFHHKQEGEKGYDMYLRHVQPRPGVEWELAMTNDQDTEWLGLHNFDDRYKHGSEEADRRVKELGYCRVHMPSVPRTGSTWFRAMFETATSQPSFSMWKEGGTLKKHYQAFSSDDPCGGSLDHMEGILTSKKKFPCRDVRPPNATSPILYKSHTPFFPSYNKPGLMPDQTCMLLLLVRNPIDNYDAWQRYNVQSIVFRDFLPTWQGHISHWVAAAGDIPIYVFRYEDMLLRTEEMLRRILQILPGGWKWSDESVAKAMSLYGPKKPFREKCGAAFKRVSLGEVEMARTHYSSYMRHLGYRFTKK